MAVIAGGVNNNINDGCALLRCAGLPNFAYCIVYKNRAKMYVMNTFCLLGNMSVALVLCHYSNSTVLSLKCS